MKKLLVGMASALLLLGAGCASSIPLLGGDDTVEGKWHLSFDLPEGWVMVRDYSSPRYTVVTTNDDVSREDSDIILQSTSLPLVIGGVGPEDSVPADSYASGDFSLVHVYRLDDRRVVPSEAEDLGDGWYRLKICEDGEDCMIYGQYNYDYYFVSSSGAKYKFSITTKGQDPLAVIDMIMSAEEVTDFTDNPRVDVETETK